MLFSEHILMHNTDKQKLPILDQHTPADLQTATMGMGCFWGSEAVLGAMEGVVRTRVGYTGGSTENPTYRTLADHIETVQVNFDAAILPFSKLLKVFFTNHTPTTAPRKRQYTSALFYHSSEQQQLIHFAINEAEVALGQKVKTEVMPFQAFYLAEERHQKWKLRRAPEILNEFEAIYPAFQDLNNSTAVARVNGYLGGFGEKEQFLEDLAALGLSYAAQNMLLNQFQLKDSGTMGDISFKKTD